MRKRGINLTVLEIYGESVLKKLDPEVYNLLHSEESRRQDGIELIASENHTSLDVMEAQASVMTDKYAEGYPGKRYYGGCEYYDQMENLAIERAKKAIGAEHANVQPHSGAQVNMIAYESFMEHGDTALGLNLDNGGHLTHGASVNFSGKFYNFIPYGISAKTGRIDMPAVEKLAKEHKPKLILCGASAYPRDWDYKHFREIADSADAYMMVDMAHIAGLIAAKVQNDPIPYADVVTSTTQKTLRGPRGGLILCREEYAKAVDFATFPNIQAGPFMHTIAAKAVCFANLMKPEFKAYAKQVLKNAEALANGLIGYDFNLISGGTDNHLMLIDLRNKGITGKAAQILFEGARITLNKNMIPDDPEKPFITSGVRVGTPAVTTRGMKVPEMKKIAGWINTITENKDDEKMVAEIGKEVTELAHKFKLPWDR